MSEKTETIEDIIRGMRKLAGVIRKKERVEGYEIVNAWSGYEHFANRILEAHKSELEAKDAEIARLRALVGELADVLGWCNKQADSIGAASLLPVGFPMISLTMIMAAMSQRCNKIVAKAREEVKDGE